MWTSLNTWNRPWRLSHILPQYELKKLWTSKTVSKLSLDFLKANKLYFPGLQNYLHNLLMCFSIQWSQCHNILVSLELKHIFTLLYNLVKLCPMLCLKWDHYVPVHIHSTPIFTQQYFKRIYTTFPLFSFDIKICHKPKKILKTQVHISKQIRGSLCILNKMRLLILWKERTGNRVRDVHIYKIFHKFIFVRNLICFWTSHRNP